MLVFFKERIICVQLNMRTSSAERERAEAERHALKVRKAALCANIERPRTDNEKTKHGIRGFVSLSHIHVMCVLTLLSSTSSSSRCYAYEWSGRMRHHLIIPIERSSNKNLIISSNRSKSGINDNEHGFQKLTCWTTINDRHTGRSNDIADAVAFYDRSQQTSHIYCANLARSQTFIGVCLLAFVKRIKIENFACHSKVMSKTTKKKTILKQK